MLINMYKHFCFSCRQEYCISQMIQIHFQFDRVSVWNKMSNASINKSINVRSIEAYIECLYTLVIFGLEKTQIIQKQMQILPQNHHHQQQMETCQICGELVINALNLLNTQITMILLFFNNCIWSQYIKHWRVESNSMYFYFK